MLISSSVFARLDSKVLEETAKTAAPVNEGNLKARVARVTVGIARREPHAGVRRLLVKSNQSTVPRVPGIQRAPPVPRAGMAATRTRMAKGVAESAELALTVLATV